MIPVQLRLSNFLSYGTDAPVLDFEQFRVACLSGRNGQGKSALLDAITWAIWGEARKSSNNRKPDDELIRIGTQRMQVELVFDVEGVRYRVVRSYSRSATGKTSRPELEFGIFEPESKSFRPLTGSTIRETQEQLNRILGIDYDTFINSAFLLQGRSDEFTKKNPSERKEILSRILNLGKFEQLAQLAREREREADDQIKQCEREIERLTGALENEEEWRRSRSETLEKVKALQGNLDVLRKEEARLTREIAILEAKDREAASIKDQLESINAQIEQCEKDERRLTRQLAEADAILKQKDQIERDYNRLEALQKERDELDTRRDLFRGIEKQIDIKQNELKDRRNELEKKAHSLQVKLQSARDSLMQCEGTLAEGPVLRQKMENVQKAQKRLTELNVLVEQKNALSLQIIEIQRELHGLKESTASELKVLRDQIRQQEKSQPSIIDLERQKRELEIRKSKSEALKAKLEETTKNGQQIGEKIKERSGQVLSLEQELKEQEETFTRVRTVQNGVCPTCGTALTQKHKIEVETRFRTKIEAIKRKIKEHEVWIAKKEADRSKLRNEYRELQEQIDEHKDVHEQLAAVEEQMRAYGELQQHLNQQKARVVELQRTLESESYGQRQRQQLKELSKRLDSIVFDNEEFERVRTEAAQFDRFRERLQALEEASGRKQQLERSIDQYEKEISQVSNQLEGSGVLCELQAEILRLKEKLAAIGFDPERFDKVRRELRDLQQAGARMKDLLHAQQNRIEWKDQIDRIRGRQSEYVAEKERLNEQLTRVVSELEQKASVKEAFQKKVEERSEVEQQLTGLQKYLGELTARIEQAEKDRKSLLAQRKTYAEAEHKKRLYKQLRNAFGKHGIPSLIIEETLPEIEERSNDILERLTDGKMHVRLETLRDKKTGGTAETLNIIITDELGVPRPYETFSGGEAFRVNFALRIALAQLLAERSGVRIRTLVVDEGFGTQDIQGIQSLIESIQAIQEDFDKILVITHMDHLKEAFPIRIEVEKDPVDGSRFQVIGV